MFYCNISKFKSSGKNLFEVIWSLFVACVWVCACEHIVQIFCGCTIFVESIQGNVTHSFCAERGV